MIGVRTAGLTALRALALASALCAIAVSCAPAAEGERKLDPLLSLTGSCSVDALDPVADPDCPYPSYPEGPYAPFANPKAVATDSYGNIYVSSFGKKENGSEGRIDIFGPGGTFISEMKLTELMGKPTGPTSLAIDSQGNLYVAAEVETLRPILRFSPDAPYEPEDGKIEYSSPPVELAEVGELSVYTGLAINADNDHLFANFGSGGVREYASAEEGNTKIRSTPAASWGGGVGVAVDAVRDRLYASAGLAEERIDVFDLNSVEGTPPSDKYEKIGAIEDSAVPGGDLGYRFSVAVDEATGHVFVLDGGNCNLYEFNEALNFITAIDYGFQCTYAEEIGVDNGPFSANGVLGEKGRYLYVPSHEKGTGHSFAFFESQVRPPDVKSLAAANISEDEAELQAQINPGNLATTYTFEIKAEGASWTEVGKGALAAGNLDVEASVVAAGLEEGTNYHFRVVAENEEGSDAKEASFATYPSVPLEPQPCPNALLRTGPSGLLPDCRAYELVTPPDPNAHAPIGTGTLGGIFTNRQVSPVGDKVPFKVEGGSLPGLGGVGSFFGDPYLSTRTPTGWSTAYTGPSSAESTSVVAGTSSPDQGYSFWLAEGSGSAVLGGTTSNVRYPDGHSEPLGKGSIGLDHEAVGKLISEGGGHIIFATGAYASPDTAVQLEPDAAPDGTQAVYDRTSDGITHVVSLKPGNVPFGAGEDAVFHGASLDGKGVAFEVGGRLYLRYDNSETFEIGEGVDFAGIAEGGSRIFYMQSGDLKAFEAKNEATIAYSESGDVTPVQISVDGSAAYFASPSVLTSGEANPNGDEAQAGEQNLYLSDEGQISFVGVVTDRDVEGKGGVDGLGLWVSAVGLPAPGRLAIVPARTSDDGGVLLFKSRAALSNYDPEGHAQIYRYDSVEEELLQCLSCHPTGAAASSDADLQSENREGSALFYPFAWLENLRADGRRAFFESSEALIARDSDGLQDVYEWEDEGVGSCARPGGCLYLISSPQSLRNEYLWAISQSGDDVFFLSSDLLVGADADETPSIYDARVGGGFPEQVQKTCEGEGCRPQISPLPLMPGVQTSGQNATGSFKPRHCPKGKRKVKRAGKVRCVKKHKHHRRRGGRR